VLSFTVGKKEEGMLYLPIYNALVMVSPVPPLYNLLGSRNRLVLRTRPVFSKRLLSSAARPVDGAPKLGGSRTGRVYHTVFTVDGQDTK